jgi:hypothetical protein
VRVFSGERHKVAAGAAIPAEEMAELGIVPYSNTLRML